MREQNVARRRQQDAVDAEERAKAATQAAATTSGAAASNAVPSPAAQPEAAVAGVQTKDPHAPLIDAAQHEPLTAKVPEPTAAERAGHAPILEGVPKAGELTAIGTATSST